ncbi:MAG: response regulator [Betaproteobacteria bacterium]|nr:response regulator [Betaproteobacteria bacterium]
MAKILLLDDSPVMHRVVRLTFADDAGVEIAVARTPPEAELAISTSQLDLVISYARFPGSVDLAYFQAISKKISRILLLAESEENLDHFVAAGFNSVLRKPFHSDELRLAVEGLLAGAPESPKSSVLAGRTAPTPPSSMAPPSVPPSVPPRMSSVPTAAPASKPPPAPPSFPPITPVPAENMNPQSSFAPPQSETAGTPEETLLTMLKPSAPAKNKPESAPATVQVVSMPPTGGDEPQITMNLSFFKKPPAPPTESNSGLREKAFASEPAASVTSQAPISEASVVPPAPRAPVFEVPVAPAPRVSAGATHQQPRSIEPAAWNGEQLGLEDVMVSTRVGNSALSRQEVERIVEDSVAAAVSNAVRQALSETLPDLRQALVNEVSQRAVSQLSAELQSIKVSLRETMLAEVRDVSAQWLRRETPTLAKDVIREEIRKVIEQI